MASVSFVLRLVCALAALLLCLHVGARATPLDVEESFEREVRAPKAKFIRFGRAGQKFIRFGRSSEGMTGPDTAFPSYYLPL